MMVSKRKKMIKKRRRRGKGQHRMLRVNIRMDTNRGTSAKRTSKQRCTGNGKSKEQRYIRLHNEDVKDKIVWIE